MPSLDQIRSSIEARISDIHREMDSLQSARNALDGPAQPRGRHRSASVSSQPASSAAAVASGAPAARPQRRTWRNAQKSARQRKPAVLLAGRLETLLGESDRGLSASAIVERAGARAIQVRELLQDLAATGHVRRTGTGRGTRWMLVTDEERVAQRAAELAKLGRKRGA